MTTTTGAGAFLISAESLQQMGYISPLWGHTAASELFISFKSVAYVLFQVDSQDLFTCIELNS